MPKGLFQATKKFMQYSRTRGPISSSPVVDARSEEPDAE